MRKAPSPSSAERAPAERDRPVRSDPGAGCDPLRQRLLEAASRVFARDGYEGTKIQDIVREAGVSTGAVYGRFRSKNDLLREAVIRSTAALRHGGEGAVRFSDLIARTAALRKGDLSDNEAVRLEAYVTARREPEVARALAEAHTRWRQAVIPIMQAAADDGLLDHDNDPEAVLFLVRTLYLGVLVHRGSGLPGPDPEAWRTLLVRIGESLGPNPAASGPRREPDTAE
jgi:AcrR family transcriptional regulator